MAYLLTGGTGCLGSVLKTHLSPCFAPDKSQLDIRYPIDESSFYKSISEEECNQIHTVVHCAALLNRACESNYVEAMRTNILGTAHIADFCQRIDASLVFMSTEYVFKGDRGRYAPDDETLPINYYGHTKVAGETITRSLQNHLIIRVAFLPDVFPFPVAYKDLISSKIPLSKAVDEIVALILEGAQGIHHVCGPIRSIYEYTKDHFPDQDIKPVCCDDDVCRPQNASMVKVRTESNV